jgi:hypothetical protein
MENQIEFAFEYFWFVQEEGGGEENNDFNNMRQGLPM